MKPLYKSDLLAGLMLLVTFSLPAMAHDPIFGIGPHVLFKGGVETALEVHTNKAGEEKETETSAELVYGLTGDWAAGVDLPYAYKKDGTKSSNGVADIQVFTKYRFWRQDSKGLQESAAVMFAANLNNGDEKAAPMLGNGANDFIGGLTYGYESLKWYRWASVRYRYNGENDAGVQVGNKTLIDFVAGWRPALPEYKKPDTVWLLEFNTEVGEKSKLNGSKQPNSGGVESFISPGIFWTLRNFAIKAGVQIPVYHNLNGSQQKSDFRAKMSFEWHL
ncbi:MAG TPA: transporter [Gammaproteobacteria bacterium]|nr:transporter [Gammaproteobacteria bacterium]